MTPPSVLTSVERPRTAEAGTSIAVVAALGLVDFPRRLDIAGQTGMALITIALALVFPLMLLARLVHPSRTSQALWPFYAFALWAVGRSLLSGDLGQSGVQNLGVVVAFASGLGVASRESFDRPSLVREIEDVIGTATVVASTLYLSTALATGPGTNLLFGARSFALAALIGLAVELGRLDMTSSRSRARVLLILVAVASSLSRSAIGAAMVLVCVRAIMNIRTRGGHWLRAAGLGAALVAAGWLGASRVPALHERMFGGDQAIAVGSTRINASGREQFWGVTEHSIASSPWVGHGAGSAEDVVTEAFKSVGHPHNDYLRLLNDYGAIGLTLWILGLLTVVSRLAHIIRGAINDDDRRSARSSLMVLLALSIVMITDNVVVYVFVMGPAAVLLGATVGLRATRVHDERLVSQCIPRRAPADGRFE